MSSSLDTLNLVPARENRRRSLLMAAALAVVLVSSAALTTGRDGALAIGIACAAGFALLWGHLYRARIIVTPQEVRVVGLLLRRRRSRARIASIVRAAVIPLRGPITDSVFLLDSHRRVVLRIYGHNYTREDLDRLVGWLQVPWSGPDRPVTAKQLGGMYPGIVPWIERRPFVFAFALAGGTLAVLVIISLIVAAVLAGEYGL